MWIVELSLPEESLHALDPSRCVDRLVREIPGALVCMRDLAQKDVTLFREMGADGALGIAEADARRRGPIWAFRIHADGVWIAGSVERRRFSIQRDDQDVPAELKGRFLGFLQSLETPGATVASYRTEGNDRIPT
ncbi:MAG: hypothetical protein AAF533_12660 [Acidobacteriota bacterium]